MKKINILFLGGAKRYSLAERFISSGKKLGYSVSIFSYELNSDVPIVGIAKIIIGKRWNDNDVFDHLQKIIIENKINIILPFVDPAISLIAQFKIKFASKVFIPVSGNEICTIMFNKLVANQWFIEHDFPIPSQEKDFPLIAKPLTGSASQGIVKIINKEEFSSFKEKNDIDKYLIQKFIDADEYTVDCYVSSSKKEILGIVPRKRIEIVGGEVTKAITCKDDQIISISERILNSGNFIGPITIQFLKEKLTGKVYVMEINPRFGGGVINSIEAGFDIPLFILKEFLGQPVKPIEEWKINLLMMRTNREIFLCKL